MEKLGTSETTQQVNAEPDNFSSMPRTNRERSNTLGLFSDHHTCVVAHLRADTHT